jgi:surface carbohydrate biosynthesis protein
MIVIKFLQKLRKIKFRFNRIERSQVIIFGSGQSAEIFKKDLKDISFSILPLINFEINFRILLKCLLNLKFNKYYYYLKFINSSGAKVVITYIDNSLDFYLLENHFKDSQVKFVAVQNGWRSIENDLKFIRSTYTNKGLCHKGFYMAFSKDIGEMLFPDRKVIGIGSLKNNLVGITGTRDIDVLYISQYQPNKSEELLAKVNNNEDNSFSPEYLTLKVLISWCQLNNVHLSILLRSQTHKIEEVSFYQSFLPFDTFNFINRKGVLSNYSVIDRAKLVITVDSTLGYEALSRGCRIIFFSMRNFFTSKNNDLKFGFPLNLPPDGPFWTSDPDEVKMFNYLSVINRMNDLEWRNLIAEYKDLFMIYSENNRLYKQKIREILMN